MDPYQLAQRQGQVMGAKAPADDADAAEDLMDLLVRAYAAAGHLGQLTSPGERDAVARFAAFGNEYLAGRRVVSTGVVDGNFSLVFDDGQAVPLASAEEKAERPDSTVPITRPRDSKMKGMPVVDGSVAITTGTVGSPTRPAR